MLYRAAERKLQDLSLSRRRPFTKRPVKVDIPAVPIVDQREVAFCHFTEIASIGRKTKSKRGYRSKHQESNKFAAWLGMSRANDSSGIVEVPGCDSTGVGASTKYTTPNKSSVVNDGNASKIYQQMKTLETAVDSEPSLPSNDFRPTTEMIGIEHTVVDDCDSEMTQPTRKALIRQVISVELVVAMLNGLSLDDKRKLNESDKEHFETFQAHRPYARPYAKRMKVSNN